MWASRHRRTPRRRTVVGRLLVAAGAILLALAAYAFAAPAPEEGRFDRTIRYLQNAQNLDGGFGRKPGAPSDPMLSSWAAIALAAGGINPQDQAKPGGTDVHAYLTANADRLSVTTDFERAALVAIAAGTPLRAFGGVDLIARILERGRGDGSFGHTDRGDDAGVNDTIWAVFALSRADGAEAATAVQAAADWIVTAQNDDDGWPATTVGAITDYDMTGAAIQALVAAGLTDARASAVADAVRALREVQLPDGGFPAVVGDRSSNSASTAWVVQGLWSLGIDPSSWRTDAGRDPLDYLSSLQQDDGSIVWKASDPSGYPLWMTAYAAPAYAGRFNPPTTVPRRDPSVRPPPTTTTPPPPQQTPGTGGDGGMSGGTDGSVIAGGDGAGSPLFRSPKPQSRGKTRGGVRRAQAVRERRDRRARRARVEDVPDEQLAAGPRSAREREDARGAPAPAPAPQQPPPGRPAPEQAEGTATGAGDDVSGAAATDDTEDRAGGGGGSDARGAGGSGGAGAGDPEVTGKLIGGVPQEAGAPGPDGPAAPGLRGARAGGEQGPALALGIAGALCLCSGLGSLLERRRPQDEQEAAA